MARVLKVAAVVVGVTALAFTGIGLGVGLSLGAATSFGFGVSASTLFLVSAGLSAASSLLSPRPKAPEVSSAVADRLNVSIDVRTPRKIVFGHTALATDLRDQEYSSDQTYLHRFVVVASHRIDGVEAIFFDDKLAWISGGGVQGEFANYLTVAIVTEGSAANAIDIGPRMGSSRRYTGCAYVHFRYRLTGIDKKAESPFAQSIPSRVTIRGRGAPVFDPRVPGQSASDQASWTWHGHASRNPALQLLFYLLGWRIQNPVTGDWKLAVGKGIPPERIDLDSFITGANICDEGVAIAAGGGEPRYRSDGIFSEGDDPGLVIENLKAAMNAVLDDVDGRIRLTVLHNDLGTPAGSLSEADVLGEFRWEQTPELSSTFNVVRGSFTDPSDTALYQQNEYPEVRIDSPDGIERVETVNLPMVQSVSQARRLAKQRLQRMLYSGTFAATFLSGAWKFQKGDVILFTFRPLGWIDKPMRIIDAAVQVDGLVPMVLRVEHADIYAWSSSDERPVNRVAPTTYDRQLLPIIGAIDDLAGDVDGLLDAYQTTDGQLGIVALDFAALVTLTAAAVATGTLDDLEQLAVQRLIAQWIVRVDEMAGALIRQGRGTEAAELVDARQDWRLYIAGIPNFGEGEGPVAIDPATYAALYDEMADSYADAAALVASYGTRDQTIGTGPFVVAGMAPVGGGGLKGIGHAYSAKALLRPEIQAGLVRSDVWMGFSWIDPGNPASVAAGQSADASTLTYAFKLETVGATQKLRIKIEGAAIDYPGLPLDLPDATGARLSIQDNGETATVMFTANGAAPVPVANVPPGRYYIAKIIGEDAASEIAGISLDYAQPVDYVTGVAGPRPAVDATAGSNTVNASNIVVENGTPIATPAGWPAGPTYRFTGPGRILLRRADTAATRKSTQGAPYMLVRAYRAVAGVLPAGVTAVRLRYFDSAGVELAPNIVNLRADAGASGPVTRVVRNPAGHATYEDDVIVGFSPSAGVSMDIQLPFIELRPHEEMDAGVVAAGLPIGANAFTNPMLTLRRNGLPVGLKAYRFENGVDTHWIRDDSRIVEADSGVEVVPRPGRPFEKVALVTHFLNTEGIGTYSIRLTGSVLGGVLSVDAVNASADGLNVGANYVQPEAFPYNDGDPETDPMLAMTPIAYSVFEPENVTPGGHLVTWEAPSGNGSSIMLTGAQGASFKLSRLFIQRGSIQNFEQLDAEAAAKVAVVGVTNIADEMIERPPSHYVTRPHTNSGEELKAKDALGLADPFQPFPASLTEALVYWSTGGNTGLPGAAAGFVNQSFEHAGRLWSRSGTYDQAGTIDFWTRWQSSEARVVGKDYVLLAPNPQFLQNNLDGWFPYNNAAGGHIAVDLIEDATAPNDTKRVARFTYNGLGNPGVAPSPGYGGFIHRLDPDMIGFARPGYYPKGATIYWHIIAKVPLGYRISPETNSIGTGGALTMDSSDAGTGAWQAYRVKMVTGTEGTFGVTGFVCFRDGPNVAFEARIAHWEFSLDAAAPRVFIPENPAAATIFMGDEPVTREKVANAEQKWSEVNDDDGARPQDNADVTATSLPFAPALQTVYVTHGLVSATNPVKVYAARYAGGVNVSQLSSWSVIATTGITGTLDNDPASPMRGTYSITDMDALVGFIVLTSTHEGVVFSQTARVEKQYSAYEPVPPFAARVFPRLTLSPPGSTTAWVPITGRLSYDPSQGSGDVFLALLLTFYSQADNTEDNTVGVQVKVQSAPFGTEAWDDVTAPAPGEYSGSVANYVFAGARVVDVLNVLTLLSLSGVDLYRRDIRIVARPSDDDNIVGVAGEAMWCRSPYFPTPLDRYL